MQIFPNHSLNEIVRRRAPLLACAGVVLALGGCLPEQRIWWAPDGRLAAVLCKDSIHLVEAGGPLGLPIVGGAKDSSVTPKDLSWLPDGFVLLQEHKFATWQEVAAKIPREESLPVEVLARSMPALLADAAELALGSGDADGLLKALFPGSAPQALVAFLCAYQTENEAVTAALAKLPKGPELAEKLRSDGLLFSLNELSLVGLSGRQVSGEPKVLASSLYAMSQPKVSPGARAVAWLQAGPDSGSELSLTVGELDGPRRIAVAESALATFDWMPDGRSLVFAVPAAGKNTPLAHIRRTVVIGDSGTLNAESGTGRPERGMPASEELATAILTDPPRLQVLPDGAVFFSSLPATLPAAGDNSGVHAALFVLSADGSRITAIPAPHGSLPADPGTFVVSPDGAQIAVVGNGSDAVAVVETASGAVQTISPAHPDWRCRTLPAWKSPGELTFAALDASGRSPVWMLWSQPGGLRPISNQWPPSATANWLEKEEPSQNAPL